MLELLQNVNCYCPKPAGRLDILIAGGKICRMETTGQISPSPLMDTIIPCDGLYAFPGLIDQHIHLLGGGGEDGFDSRIPEIGIQEILAAGVTTVVGLLGADGCTRSLECLYAKAKALEIQGISSYLYAGSYQVPPVTLTGNLTRELVLIDKVIGAGEIAISDHRSSQPDVQALLKLASEVHVGGLISGKAGVVHLHVGDGKAGLNPLLQMLAASDLPSEQFVPTHVNRNPALFRQAAGYCRSGGNIDLTAGEKAGLPVSQAIGLLVGEGICLDRVTVSSDANGSVPGGGTTKIQTLYDDIRECMLQGVLPPEEAIRFVTENVARILKLYPQKGALQVGSDADILLTDKEFNLKLLMCKGNVLLKRIS